MKKLSLFLATAGLLVAACTVSAQAPNTKLQGTPNGMLRLINQGPPIGLSGVQMDSPSGKLVPVASAEPFQLNISNTPNQIVWGNLGTTVELAGSLELGSWVGGPREDFDITAQVGGAWGTADSPAEYVPEPASAGLAGMGLLGLLMLRRRRR